MVQNQLHGKGFVSGHTGRSFDRAADSLAEMESGDCWTFCERVTSFLPLSLVHLLSPAGLRPSPTWTLKTKMLQNVHPSRLWLLHPRTVLVLLLLLASAAWGAGLPKAVLSLQPPWLQVFPEDNVTLSCQGARSPEDNSTQWFHNGTAIPGQAQPRYSFKASSSHGGDYRCQTAQTSLSDPVHLDVTSAWLLLQTPRRLVPQGEPIVLRCHSWRNWRLYKITFFQDGKPKWFSYTNSSFSIPHADASHSGAYHCSGFLGRTLHASQPVSITVPDMTHGPRHARSGCVPQPLSTQLQPQLRAGSLRTKHRLLTLRSCAPDLGVCPRRDVLAISAG